MEGGLERMVLVSGMEEYIFYKGVYFMNVVVILEILSCGYFGWGLYMEFTFFIIESLPNQHNKA